MLRVLAYHRIAPAPAEGALRSSVVSATPEHFVRQMRDLADRYEVLHMEDLVAAARDRQTLPSRAALITFDDGYRDFADLAWPVLESLGLPATVFVPTSFMQSGRGFWWDQLRAALHRARGPGVKVPGWRALDCSSSEARSRELERLQSTFKTLPPAQCEELAGRITAACGLDPSSADVPAVLDWDALRGLKARGATVAAHGRSHAPLTRLAPEDVRDEISGSMADVERELGSVLPVFCFPYGDHDAAVLQIARDAGVEVGFSCRPGQNRFPAKEPLALRRTHVSLQTTPFVLRQRLRTVVSWADRWRVDRKEARRARARKLASS